VLQKRRASIAVFSPLKSQDSTKTSNTPPTFGVSSECEGSLGLPPCWTVIYFLPYVSVCNVSVATQSLEGCSTHS
jgi:hypothetical protein